MATEKSLRYKILQRAKKIKGLREELEVTIALKRRDEVLLRELKWNAKQDARAPFDSDKKIVKKAAKKKVK